MRLLRHNDEDQSVKQRHPKGLLRKIITKLLAPVIFVLAVGSIVLISPYKGWVEKGKVLILPNIIKASVQLGFVVDDISLIGQINTRKSDIIEAIKVVQGQSILEIDPKKYTQKLKTYPGLSLRSSSESYRINWSLPLPNVSQLLFGKKMKSIHH